MEDVDNNDDRDETVDNVIDMSEARSKNWLKRLARNQHGAVISSASNAIIILNNDPPLSGLLAYDAFRSEYLVTRAPPIADEGMGPATGPYPRAWTSEDVILILSYIQCAHSPKFTRNTIEDAMLAAASSARFHPVCDWLDSLKWDGIPRIDKWLANTFDCDHTPYHSAVGAKFLIAAVRRVRKPGCKFDHMLVLEGMQGIGKSTCVRVLFGDRWFSDDIPSDLKSRDAAYSLCGMWCMEFSEIEGLIRSEVETVKAFLSRSTDRYRPPYGRTFIERPRQVVLIGTTNSDDYLRDSTGNRRIWPVRCRCASARWVEIHRDQLWAEAAHREALGEQIWIDDGLVEEASRITQTRMSEDVWFDLVAAYLENNCPSREVKIAHVLTDGVHVPQERQTRREQLRVASIMRQLGWQKDIKWREVTTARGTKKTASRLWLAPDHQERKGEEDDPQQEFVGI